MYKARLLRWQGKKSISNTFIYSYSNTTPLRPIHSSQSSTLSIQKIFFKSPKPLAMTDSVETQTRNLPLVVTVETCSGGTYIVTGANVGLGFEAAKHLVALGAAKVIMGVRNVSAGEKAKAEIEAETGKTNVAEVWVLDLASYDSVKAFATKAITELDRIDALIENAAVAINERALAEGHLLSVTVNVLSTFLLGVLLLPKMSESAKQFGILPHIAIVSSGAGFDVKDAWNKIKDDPLVKMDDEEMTVLLTYVAYNCFRPSIRSNSVSRYPLTKLMEIFAVRYLATLIPPSRTGVVVNVLSPGLCKTELSRNAPAAFRSHLADQHEKFGRTAEDGSRTLLHAAVAGKESHGAYLSSCEIAE
jgi:NAD(P)-dependent dehydrogenase (short-subunit alcohol dehydrogenase family)